jgi:hypothetical protein
MGNNCNVKKVYWLGDVELLCVVVLIRETSRHLLLADDIDSAYLYLHVISQQANVLNPVPEEIGKSSYAMPDIIRATAPIIAVGHVYKLLCYTRIIMSRLL